MVTSAEFLYEKLVNEIIDVLKKQTGYEYPNVLIELGSQIVDGESVFMAMYISLIEELAFKKVHSLSLPEKESLYDNISLCVRFTLDDEEPTHLAIIREIYNRVCSLAEEAYYKYQNEEE